MVIGLMDWGELYELSGGRVVDVHLIIIMCI